MNPSQQIMVGLGAAAMPLAITYVASAIQVCTPTTTFTAFGIGTAASDRYVVVTISTGNTSATAVSSVTVGGQATTIVKSQKGTAASSSMAIILITNSPVTSGTTADIVVTMNVGAQALSIGTFAVTGLQSTTATATNGTVTNNTAMSLAVSAKGGAIGVGAAGGFDGAGGAATWTGLTKRYFIDGYATVHGAYPTGASDLSNGATLSISCNITDNYQPAFAVAAFL